MNPDQRRKAIFDELGKKFGITQDSTPEEIASFVFDTMYAMSKYVKFFDSKYPSADHKQNAVKTLTRLLEIDNV